jgi:ribonucleases P/MRP protein subunit RPP40
LTIDRGNTALLAFLDPSASFNTVDDDILLKRLQISFGISDSSLLWFHSYFSCRRQSVRCGDVTTSLVDVVCSVPQGSILGPILFLTYTADLTSVVTAHGLSVHIYADDRQIYGSCRPGCISAASLFLSSYSNSVSKGIRSNRLQLNADKTGVMRYALARLISSHPSAPVSIAGSDVVPDSIVCILQMLVDSDLGAASHV